MLALVHVRVCMRACACALRVHVMCSVCVCMRACVRLCACLCVVCVLCRRVVCDLQR